MNTRMNILENVAVIGGIVLQWACIVFLCIMICYAIWRAIRLIYKNVRRHYRDIDPLCPTRRRPKFRIIDRTYVNAFDSTVTYKYTIQWRRAFMRWRDYGGTDDLERGISYISNTYCEWERARKQRQRRSNKVRNADILFKK